jgi:CelD/BcsL family acetyltransferase involved in cellulose biosynthesis
MSDTLPIVSSVANIDVSVVMPTCRRENLVGRAVRGFLSLGSSQVCGIGRDAQCVAPENLAPPLHASSSQMNRADTAAVVPARFEFEALQGLGGYRKIESEWRQLAQTLGSQCSFQHRPEWTLAFLQSGTGDPEAVWFVSARRKGSLEAVVPLQYQNYRIGPFTPRLLGTIDDDQLQLSDFVFRKVPENAQFMQELVAWLKNRSGLSWDALRLRKVREDAAIRYAASHALPGAAQVLQHDTSAYFETHAGYEHAIRAMSGDFRRNVRRQLRRAEEICAVRSETATSGEALQRAFEQFLKIEASGWKGGAGLASAINCQPALFAFYQSLVREFGARGECVINLLWFGDEAVAGQFAVKIGRVLHILKFGYSEAFAKFAPGNVLLQRSVQQACDDAAIDMVSLVNDPPWTRRFAPPTVGVWSYFIPNNTVRGQLTLFGLLAKRALDRWRLPRTLHVSI